MPISDYLLEILCCPDTKVPVRMLPQDRLENLNEKIAEGSVKHTDGSVVEKPLREGLITDDERVIYRIDDDIPVMLIDQGILTEQLKES